MYKNSTILVDMDDVLEDLVGPWVDCLNKRHGTNVKVSEITEFDIAKFFPSLSGKEIFAPLFEDYFWDSVKPKEDAVKYLKMLKDDGFNIYVCTASHYSTIKTKLEKVLFPYFPFLSYNDIIIAKNKQMITADFLIDDGYHNLVGGNYKGILFDMPYNRSFDEKEHGITRCYTWKGIYNTIMSSLA